MIKEKNLYWGIEEKPITNSMKEISDRFVLVRKDNIDLLNEHNITYNIFSEELNECFFVKRGVKKKKFNEEQCRQIIEDRKVGLSYRALSIKYNSSTRTIQDIIKGDY